MSSFKGSGWAAGPPTIRKMAFTSSKKDDGKEGLPSLLKKVRRQAKDAVANAQASVDAELAAVAKRVAASKTATDVCIRALANDLAVLEPRAAGVAEMEASNMSLSASVSSAARRHAQLKLLVRDLQAQLEAEQQRALMLEEEIIEQTLFESSDGPSFARQPKKDEASSSSGAELRMDTASSGYGAVQIGAWRGKSPEPESAPAAVEKRHSGRRSSGGGESGRRTSAPKTVPRSSPASLDPPPEQKGSKIGRKLSFGRTIRRSLSFA